MKNSFYLKHFEKKNLQKTLVLGDPARRLDPSRMDPPSIGDYIKVGFIFKEGEKKRIQFFDGIVIGITGSLASEKKIILRKPGTYGMERVFSFQSPHIQNIKILQSQKFCRSKLFFLRKRIGKAALGITRKSTSKNNINVLKK